tara:strand:- start:111 stop:581 length:471 start_codon:yes stop_codon:yes gene_type:complete
MLDINYMDGIGSYYNTYDSCRIYKKKNLINHKYILNYKKFYKNKYKSKYDSYITKCYITITNKEINKNYISKLLEVNIDIKNRLYKDMERICIQTCEKYINKINNIMQVCDNNDHKLYVSRVLHIDKFSGRYRIPGKNVVDYLKKMYNILIMITDK